VEPLAAVALKLGIPARPEEWSASDHAIHRAYVAKKAHEAECEVVSTFGSVASGFEHHTAKRAADGTWRTSVTRDARRIRLSCAPVRISLGLRAVRGCRPRPRGAGRPRGSLRRRASRSAGGGPSDLGDDDPAPPRAARLTFGPAERGEDPQ
jgi:hypothetical protein